VAQMVPGRLPSGSSRGEQRLFAVLQRLPDGGHLLQAVLPVQVPDRPRRCSSRTSRRPLALVLEYRHG
jgi:hypothetical protein